MVKLRASSLSWAWAFCRLPRNSFIDACWETSFSCISSIFFRNALMSLSSGSSTCFKFSLFASVNLALFCSSILLAKFSNRSCICLWAASCSFTCSSSLRFSSSFWVAFCTFSWSACFNCSRNSASSCWPCRISSFCRRFSVASACTEPSSSLIFSWSSSESPFFRFLFFTT